MKKLSVLVAVLVILTVGVLPVAAITWGDVDYDHDNVGAIIVDWGPPYGLGVLCSGTLVNSQVFLTAGHCTDYLETSYTGLVWVSFDVDALALGATLLPVADIETHGDYWWGPQSNPHDVGALILGAPVVGIDPAELPDPGFLDDLKKGGELRRGREGARFTLVGYGSMLDWPPPSFIEPDGKRRAAESEFLALLKAWLVMSQNRATDDGGTCYGDSGGPAFYWDTDTETEYLVGITSWGDAQCVATGINYRVDIPATLEFIASVTPQ